MQETGWFLTGWGMLGRGVGEKGLGQSRTDMEHLEKREQNQRRARRAGTNVHSGTDACVGEVWGLRVGQTQDTSGGGRGFKGGDRQKSGGGQGPGGGADGRRHVWGRSRVQRWR